MHRTVIPNGLLLFYWVLSVGVMMIKLFNLYYEARPGDFSCLVLYAFALLTATSIFLLEYIGPKLVKLNEDDRASIPKTLLESCDIFSSLSLSYMNPLIMKATDSSLSSDTLPDIASHYNTATHSERFNRYWQNRKSDSVWTFAWCLFKAFGSFLAASIFFEVICDLAKVSLPFLLKEIIEFARSYAEGNPKPIAVGVYIAIAMFAASVCKALLNSILGLQLQWAAASVKSSLNNAVFNKALFLSGKERERRSTGEIVNLMAVDVQKITTVSFNLIILWECPIQFTFCLYGLYHLVGASAFSTFAIMAVFVPINSIMTRYIRRLRTKQMQYKDKRTRLTTEIFTNVKSLKLYNWENALLDRLYHARNDLQLKNLRHLIYVVSSLDFIWKIIPFLLSCATFTIFIYVNNVPLTPEIAFPCMALFKMLTGPIAEIPKLITLFIDSGVSVGRVRDFLICDELDPHIITKMPPANEMGEESVKMENCTFVWDKNNPGTAMLQNVDFSAHKGELSCIVGKVGAGKTSFLKALLGDINMKQGSITVKGNIAYVSQDAWLMNGTVKENILFGSKFDPEFYHKTIEACSLTTDLDILPDGDNTEIGERGVSLSGGQKARLGLARALYARADVYLMDDPLSAVDEHVSRHIMKNVVCGDGLLATKTRILATNSISVLSSADNICLLEDKRITEQGSFAQVMDQRGHIHDIVNGYGRDDGSTDSESDTDISSSVEVDTLASSQEQLQKAQAQRRNTLRRASAASFESPQSKPLLPKKTAKVKEKSQRGKVKWNVYQRYANACGRLPIIASMFTITAASTASLFGNLWLKEWVESDDQQQGVNLWFWIGGFMCIGILTAALSALRRIVCRVCCGLRASKYLHDKMVVSVVRSPMVFFETTPIGRIINRFSSDVNELDENLQTSFIDLGSMAVRLMVAVGIIIFSAPVVLLVMIPLSVLYNYYQKYYQSASRELKRLLSMSRSPIFAHFQESLNGVSTIRAFDQIDRFKHMNEASIDVHIKILYLFRTANRWLSVRLQTLGALTILATVCAIVFGATKNAFSPGMIGIMLTYVLEITDLLSSIVKSIVSLETSIVGAERVLEYCDLEGEKADIIEDNRPPVNWPYPGAIEFKDYSTRYRSNLDPVLNGIDLTISPKEKVGIVGRTGAGKSSLVMALFRIIEPIGGTIEIDGVDITQLGLHDVRSNLSIIPQDSQVFQGTIRQNIDPFGLYSDEAVWRVLEHSHLKRHIESMGEGLDSSVSESGSNLSTGQRQLMCLCRALLNSSKVLVLDEATASVDVETDQLVQETIRREFKDKTIVTIAHRLNTVMDSDKIVVIEQGKVVETGSPESLINKKALFYSLCKEGGIL
jgi:ATP-binding cassette subfamily C (CFTR/MRP) protein 1